MTEREGPFLTDFDFLTCSLWSYLAQIFCNYLSYEAMERQLWPITKLSRAASTTSDETVWRLFTSRTRSIGKQPCEQPEVAACHPDQPGHDFWR